MALPTICALAKEYETLHLVMANRDIQKLADFPRNVVDGFCIEPLIVCEKMPVQILGMYAAMGCKMVWPDHGINMLMKHAGLTPPRELPRPKIKIPDVNVPRYDVLLAPWAAGPERCMDGAQVIELVEKLLADNLTVGMVGAHGDPAPQLLAATTYYGWPFGHVARLMQHAGVVVTVESFPGRLAHAAGIKEHIILSTPITPKHAQGHPGATFVNGKLNGRVPEFDLHEITAAINGVLATA